MMCLQVYDSVAEDGQGIWMSGVNDKKVRYSNFSTLMIRFTSDASVTRKGFILVYTAVGKSFYSRNQVFTQWLKVQS